MALRLMSKRPEDRALPGMPDLALPERGFSRKHSPARRRTIAAATSAIAILASAIVIWMFAVQWPREQGVSKLVEPDITDIRVNPTELTAEIRFGAEDWQSLFPNLPDRRPLAESIQSLQVGRDQRTYVVVGLAAPYRDCNLWLIDPLKRGSDEMYVGGMLIQDDANIAWPGDLPTDHWVCNGLAVGDVDGDGREDVVVAAHHNTYCPTCIAIVKVLEDGTLQNEARFWHLGHVKEIEIVPGYFDEGRTSAIVAWGIGNYVDCFAELLTQEEAAYQVSDWPRVSSLMILNPRTMNQGIGAPRSPLCPSERVFQGVHAYAFLDLPADCPPAEMPRFSAKLRDCCNEERARFEAVRLMPNKRIELHVVRQATSRGAILSLDDKLEAVHIRPTDEHDTDWWRAHWKVIYQAE